MRNKTLTAVMLCGVLLLGGCGKAEAGSGEASQGSAAQGSVAQGETGEELQEENGSDDGSKEQEVSLSEGGEGPVQDHANMGEGVVVIEGGPEKKLYSDGNLVYTLHDFKFYDSPKEASIAQDEIVTADAKYYMDRSKFLTVQVDINNIDYAGSENDGEGEMNISLFTIAPNEPNETDESLEWAGSYPVYLSEHGEAEKYYHVWVKPGETKTVLIGFYVPVKDITELRSQCIISLYGSYDDGYVYDIPEVQ